MENTARLVSPKNHRLIFDMKGSTLKRYSKNSKIEGEGKLFSCKVMKDLNFVDLNHRFGSKFFNIDCD
jgi:hypothetical protein